MLTLRRYQMDKSKAGCRPRTVHSAFHALIGLGEYLIEQGVLTENPAKQVKLPKKDAAVRHILSDADVMALFDACQHQRTARQRALNRAVLSVLAYAALRREECCDLLVEVFINANGQLGTVKSSRRFKKDIHNMGTVSDKLMQLRPVTFRYKQAAEDGSHPKQYGLIAEEVAKIYPDLVQYDKQGKPFTIYYHLLTPMLLSELQKEHRRNDAQRIEINTLKAELASLKQSQEKQGKMLAKLAALVEASHDKALEQKAVFVQY